MKKIFTMLMLILTFSFFNFISIDNVSAASASISVTGTKTVVVGNTVKVTVTISSSNSLGSWEFDVKYDTNKLTLVSSTLESSTRAVNVLTSSGTKSKTYTLTFRAKSSGSAKISIANALVVGWDEAIMSTNSGSLTFNLVTQKELEDSYSSDNYLKSLSVEGYELTPKFDKNTLEYNLELENGVQSILVKASKSDSKASISGVGNQTLTEGENKITIAVMAENGNVKNYIINAKVKELNPIIVNINGEEYNVIRKIEGLDIPSTFTETNTLIDGEKVPAFESSITGYQLVALKNSSGKINFYINDNGKYTLYEEVMFNGVILYPMTPDTKEIPNGYIESGTTTINGTVINLYRNENNTYPLIYGINIETGDKNWYTLDDEEKTLQRYESIEITPIDTADKYIILISILGGTSLLLIVFIILLNNKMRKISNKKEVN